mmetsp:Transcript_4590/g.5298  ORF Transcript_4590/g.5298 Transcript_4590/m.5298 type:complete len:368 (+) Transcript_4590:84-1187(+)
MNTGKFSIAYLRRSVLVLVSKKRIRSAIIPCKLKDSAFIVNKQDTVRTYSGTTQFRFTNANDGDGDFGKDSTTTTESETETDSENQNNTTQLETGAGAVIEPERIQKKGGRFYRVTEPDGSYIDLPSVTTVLGDIWKSHLKDWAVKTCINQIETDLNSQVANGNLKKVIHDERVWKDWMNQLKDRAVKVPDTIRDDAATLGTECHDIIDEIIKGERVIEDGELTEIPKQTQPVAKAFLKWRKECNIDINSAGDQFVWSKKFEYAGAMDAIGRDLKTEKLVAIDFKTSNSISSTYALQVAAYAKAYEEIHGERVDRAIVVKFDKFEPKYEVHEVVDIDVAFNGFKSALYLHRLKSFQMMTRNEKKRVL